MTEQEIFIKVATHLLQQGKVSKNDHNCCAYRGKGNTKCAIGCLIPDEVYIQDIEEKNVYGLFINFQPLLESCVGTLSKPKFELLKKLQKIHDNTDVNTWKEHLNQLAKEYELEPIP